MRNVVQLLFFAVLFSGSFSVAQMRPPVPGDGRDHGRDWDHGRDRGGWGDRDGRGDGGRWRDRDGRGDRGVRIDNPTVNGYVPAAGANMEAASQSICQMNGFATGQTLATEWVVKAPGAFFNGRQWTYSPQADNYNRISAVLCFRGGSGPVQPGRPDMVYDKPQLNGYPIFADQETADAYCRMYRYGRGVILQSVYIDTNARYSFQRGNWIFSPNADHYMRIESLACYRF